MLVVRNPPGNVGDAGGSFDPIPGSRRSLGGGHGNPLQYSCLENPMDTGAWWDVGYRATKSQARLKRQHSIVKGTRIIKLVELCFEKYAPLPVKYMAIGKFLSFSETVSSQIDLIKPFLAGSWGLDGSRERSPGSWDACRSRTPSQEELRSSWLFPGSLGMNLNSKALQEGMREVQLVNSKDQTLRTRSVWRHFSRCQHW